MSSTVTALAAAQAVDCVTTQAIQRSGGYERDPVSRAIGANRSLVLCAAGSALIDLGLCRLKNGTALRVYLGLEALTVGNNFRILVRLSK